MEKRDFKKTLELLGKMLELKEELTKQFEDIEEENDEEAEHQQIADDLQNDYEKFMIWCFGEDFHKMTRPTSIIRWKELHPKLSLPRTLLIKFISKDMYTMCLMIDAYPLYLEHKKSA